ncbi:hypothetical protein [Streptomyces sp. NPDC088794]|uniref:hypothetical protein n=1 Tax=Streptomyces sp. NPDC088794 TaxID=3365902 RepID=UPI00380DCB93
MGIKRVVEVLKFAPADLTPAERMVLVAIGENIRDEDPTRETWADFNASILAQRAGLAGSGSLKSALQRLAKRGLEVRIPIAHGKDGRALYAVPGKQCRYRFPILAKGEVTTSPYDQQGEATTSAGEVTTSPKGRSGPRQAGSEPPPTPHPSTPQPSAGGETRAAPWCVAEGEQQHDEVLADAVAFLETLPAPWTIGPKTAALMAPELAQMTSKQGWALDDELIAKLTEKAATVRNHSQILRIRIGDLPKRIRPAPRKPRGPLPPWCGECADGAKAAEREGHLRQIYDDRGNARPCPKCHPTQTAHAA